VRKGSGEEAEPDAASGGGAWRGRAAIVPVLFRQFQKRSFAIPGVLGSIL